MGTGVDNVVSAFSDHDVDTVFIGADIEPEAKIEMIRTILAADEGASIHLLDHNEDMMPFVNGVLTGVTWHQWDWATKPSYIDEVPARARDQAAVPNRKPGLLRRIWSYWFGRSDAPEHPPPPPYSPGAGI